MTMHNTWLIEDAVVYTQFRGASSVDEVRSKMIEIREMCAGSPRALVHVIANIEELTKPLPLNQAVKVVREVGITSNLGWALIVGARTQLIKFVVNSSASLFQRRLRNFDTLEEALEFLNRMDVNLNQETEVIQVRDSLINYHGHNI